MYNKEDLLIDLERAGVKYFKSSQYNDVIELELEPAYNFYVTEKIGRAHV